jgi:uncharacterized membrane protein YbhN (UPF0104 family)
MMFKAFGIDISYIKVLFGYTLIFLSYIFPHPPAQIGSNELIMILIFTAGFKYSKNLTSAIMILSHFIATIVLFITGTFSLIFSGISVIDIFKSPRPSNHKDTKGNHEDTIINS